MDKIRNRLARKLSQAMELKCPLRLKRLQVAHALKDGHGTAIANSFDGVAMFLAEETEQFVHGTRCSVRMRCHN